MPREPDALLDPRTHAYRDDLADAKLQGQVSAARFVSGKAHSLTAHRTPIRSAPHPEAGQTSEALFGEALWVFEIKDGWAWAQLSRDGYVGYVEASALGEPGGKDNQAFRISAPRALIFAAPDLKSAVRGWLPMAARIEVQERSGPYVQLASGGWTHENWIASADTEFPDFVATADRFAQAPYGWGGCTVAGLDCSGLVQLALIMAGYACPRDSDQQAASLGDLVAAGAPFMRGDLVFFPGHVGLMVDDTHLLHANATHMAVTVNPLRDVEEIVRRSDSQGRGITARKRLSAVQ
ncbi:MAG: NlpC/P60 family protein [Pseudomonadota bacterium]